MGRIAAIDVGSNAMRMVTGEVDKRGRLNTLGNIRLPVRLGQDVFGQGFLEEETLRQTEAAFLHFRQVAEHFHIRHLRAVATSAAREAANRDLLLERVLRASGISIEVIAGQEEARLVHRVVVHALKLQSQRMLLIDIGGGSVEVTLAAGQTILSTESYAMGTVRLLQQVGPGDQSKQSFEKLAQPCLEALGARLGRDLREQQVQLCAATGGNVEALGRLRQKLFKAESNRCVTLAELEELIERLERLTYEQRMRTLKLRPDRADVILPAAVLLYQVARAAGVKQIAIPQVGLKDGVLLELAADLPGSLRPSGSVRAASGIRMITRYDNV